MNERPNFVKKLISNTTDCEKAAYIYDGLPISYNDLYNHASTMATALQEWGLVAGDRILLMMYDTPAFAEVFLAALWVGAIPIPLNPKLRRDSIQHVLRDSDAKALVCERENRDTISESLSLKQREKISIILQDIYVNSEQQQQSGLSLADALWFSQSTRFAPNRHGAHFWQYTSGTTGSPKAVMHRVDGMEKSNSLYARDVLGIQNNCRIYSTAKMFFGYGLGNSFFFTLLNNATALLDNRWPSSANILANIKQFHPDFFFSVPTIYNDLLSAIITDDDSIQKYFSVDICLVSAGSPLPATLFSTWMQRFDLEILDGIGATELGHIFLSNRPGMAKAGSTGVPVPGYQLRLDKHGDIQSAGGDQGVLLVKGPSVSLGYYGSPAKTAEKFSDGWYHTGDVFTCDKDGCYSYVGREDDLFKVKGRWVVPQDIESFVTGNFGCVREAALVPHYNHSSLIEPVIFIAACEEKQDRIATMNDIHSYLKECFPPHAIPVAYYFIDELPKNINGKTIRQQMIEQAEAVVDDQALLPLMPDTQGNFKYMV